MTAMATEVTGCRPSWLSVDLAVAGGLLRRRPPHTLVRPDRRDEARRHGNLAMIRQRIEAIINTAKAQLSLEHHGGRTPAGVMARTAQRILALAAAIWHNWASARR